MSKMFFKKIFAHENMKNNTLKCFFSIANRPKTSPNHILCSIKMSPCTHFLYRFLDCKKTTRSQFSVPGLREIHRNLVQERKFNSRESFFRKSPFCTFSCINPGFGGPWDKLCIFFLVVIFIMLQKNAFGQNFF